MCYNMLDLDRGAIPRMDGFHDWGFWSLPRPEMKTRVANERRIHALPCPWPRLLPTQFHISICNIFLHFTNVFYNIFIHFTMLFAIFSYTLQYLLQYFPTIYNIICNIFLQFTILFAIFPKIYNVIWKYFAILYFLLLVAHNSHSVSAFKLQNHEKLLAIIYIFICDISIVQIAIRLLKLHHYWYQLMLN